MEQTDSIVKPFRKLTQDDFTRFPVWEWVLDESSAEDSDETIVRSVRYDEIPKKEFAQFLVSARAMLSDKSEIPACVEVTVNFDRVVFEPLFVFLLDRHLDFVGMETTRLLSRYTKSLNNKPISWELNVMLAGEKKLRTRKVQVSGAIARAIEFVSKLPHNQNK